MAHPINIFLCTSNAAHLSRICRNTQHLLSSSGSWEAVLGESEFPLRAHLQAGAATCHGACRTTAQVLKRASSTKKGRALSPAHRYPIFIGPGGGRGAPSVGFDQTVSNPRPITRLLINSRPICLNVRAS